MIILHSAPVIGLIMLARAAGAASMFDAHSQQRLLRTGPNNSHATAAGSEVVVWPWSNNNNNKTSSCTSYTNCNTCTDASWCHWCDHDQACHIMGSMYGCVSGSNCAPPDGKKKKHDPNDSCAAHLNCSECALSSKLCHWCAHDNACHAVGSVYGCVTGVDCYSNGRCQRKHPEPLHHIVFTQMGFVPMMMVVTVGTILSCCASLFFCCASGIKGAYDDLAEIGIHSAAETTADDNGPAPVATTQSAMNETASSDEVVVTDEYQPLVGATETEAQQRPSPPAPRHMQRLYNACTVCFAITLFVISACVIAIVRYYPKTPQYNICNDSVAWRSIIDTITNVKATADFEILASVSNPNHFDAVLDQGRGSFTHNGAFVGTFDIPPTTVQAMAITDVLVVAHLSPDKWDALSLTAAYYSGKLVLDVDVHAAIRVPALFDASFASDLRNIVVHVNEKSDRHLCACPSWSEAKNATSGTALQ